MKTVPIALALSLAAAGPALAQDRPVLTVYTYGSFISEWGPGPAVEAAFEAECGCDLEWVPLDDGVAILSRLRLEGASTDADIVLGLDNNLIAEARATGLLAPHGVALDALALPIAWTDDVFVPFDWGYFAFVYDSEAMPTPPASLHELVESSDAPLLIQDPRTSTPGLGLLLWMKRVFGDGAADAWAALRPRIVTVSSSWSDAYGLFLAGEAPMVLSYSTSPAYHILAEGTDRYRAAVFQEGHYLQVEVAARTASSDQPDLAQRFLSFMLTPAFQDAVPQTNWMYPAITPQEPLPEAFQSAIDPAHALAFTPEEVAENRRAWVDEWLAAMSR